MFVKILLVPTNYKHQDSNAHNRCTVG